jgi:hypothetical protein
MVRVARNQASPIRGTKCASYADLAAQKSLWLMLKHKRLSKKRADRSSPVLRDEFSDQMPVDRCSANAGTATDG